MQTTHAHKAVPQPVTSRTAVIVGAAVGNGLSYAVLFAAGLVFLWYLVSTGVPGNEVYAKAYQSSAYLLFAHALGFACLVPGGYWTSRLSPSAKVRNAVFAGLLVVAFTLLANFMPYELPIPLWSRALSVLLPVPAFLVGALLYERERPGT